MSTYSVEISAWIIDSVMNYNINISKYNTLVGSSYIEFSKELDHPKKGLIFKILLKINDLNAV